MERNTEAVLKAARLGDVPMLTQLHNEVRLNLYITYSRNLDDIIDRASLCLPLTRQPKQLSITALGKKFKYVLCKQVHNVDFIFKFCRFGHPAVVKFLLGAAPQTIGEKGIPNFPDFSNSFQLI